MAVNQSVEILMTRQLYLFRHRDAAPLCVPARMEKYSMPPCGVEGGKPSLRLRKPMRCPSPCLCLRLRHRCLTREWEAEACNAWAPRPSYLPATEVGSPRHAAQSAANANAIFVAHKTHRPLLFITNTCKRA